MYMVRPQFFIVFLNIVTALGLKYKDIMQGYNFEKEQFKESQDILNEFEEMKDDTLEKSIKNIVFENVSFSYNSSIIFNNLNLSFIE